MVELSKPLNLSLEEMQEHETLLISAVDHDFTIILWNCGIERLFGIPKEMAVGRNLFTLIPSASQDERTAHLRNALGGKSLILFRQKYQRKGGYYNQHIIPVRNEQNEVIAVLNIMQDIEESLDEDILFDYV